MFRNEAPRPEKGILVSAKMGRSLVLPVEGSNDPNRKKVVAQPEKGLLYVDLDDMNIPHLRWKNRTTNEIEMDLMILPDEVVFKKAQENQDGKVYIVKYVEARVATQEGGVFAFWLQDEEYDKEGDLEEKFDRELNINSKRRLNPNAKIEEPPKRTKKSSPEASPDPSGPSTSTEAPLAPNGTPEPEESDPVAAIADAYSTSICDSAVVQASGAEPTDSVAEDVEETVETETQRGKEKRSARSDVAESPQGPVAKRNRPSDGDDA
ncbi:hypothetical protein CAEBREN_23971 [Caenorhabditis brenneri]|uniref:Pru domain-containing protein n=1 Tax=Caenorhabditis brenneri TaxID=135651 RepID=G0NGP9_CAEBE|nr:hypothetical protein CAEBREN_23971 [Caenorhabditis brenneri]